MLGSRRIPQQSLIGHQSLFRPQQFGPDRIQTHIDENVLPAITTIHHAYPGVRFGEGGW